MLVKMKTLTLFCPTCDSSTQTDFPPSTITIWRRVIRICPVTGTLASLKSTCGPKTDNYTGYMRSCRKTDPATVVRVTKNDFLDFNVLQKEVNKGGQTQAGFKGARRLVVSADYPEGVTVCRGYGDGVHDPVKWNLQKESGRKRANLDLSRVDLPLMYPSGVIINKKKLQHIKFLADYVPRPFRIFYNNMFPTQEGVDPATVED